MFSNRQSIFKCAISWREPSGTPSADIFRGGLGDDTWNTGEGSDILDGGFGSDNLTGGGGSDTFVFKTSPIDGEVDTITDFNSDEGDVIQLKGTVFFLDDFIGGTLPEEMFVSGVTPTDFLPQFLYDLEAGALYFDEDGIGEAAALQIALIEKLGAN